MFNYTFYLYKINAIRLEYVHQLQKFLKQESYLCSNSPIIYEEHPSCNKNKNLKSIIP